MDKNKSLIKEIFNMAVKNHKKNKIKEAQELYSQVLKINPYHEDTNQNLGAIFQNLNKPQKAINCLEKVIGINPNNINALNNLGVVFQNLNEPQKAINYFKKVIEINPNDINALNNLGVMFQNLNEQIKAKNYYEKIIEINPSYSKAYNNLGTIFQNLSEPIKAKKFYEKAIEIDPNYSKAHNNLGVIFQEMGELHKALDCYEKLIKINPNYAPTYCNLGIIFNELGENQKAINYFKKSTEIDSYNISAHNNLGIVHKKIGEYQKAINYYKKAIEIDPNNLVSINGLTELLTSTILDDKSYLKNICLFLFRKNNVSHNDISHNAKLALLNEEHVYQIKEIVNSESSLFFNLFIQKLIKEELFHLMLQKSLITDKFLEKLLNKLRCEILFSLNKSNRNILGENLDFLISLAEQCWLNEFIYIYSKKETDHVNKLKNKIENNEKINEIDIAIFGCYVPLNDSEIIINQLLNYESKNILFNDLIKIQIKEPLKEKKLVKSITSLDEIIDPISNKVRKQYEENPYPRWRFINETLKSQFSLVINAAINPNKIDYNRKFNNPNVLIAGCGTGSNSISANIYKNANILAVDLSLKSIAYAKRKTEELGYKNIEYLHADILQLKKLGRKFDIIESSGVLHHMNDPVAGLKVLLNILEPHGFLRLGLYSEIARQYVVRARELIKIKNFKNTNEDIKRFRQLIINEKLDSSLQNLTDTLDFYSTSTIRDLLFHIQEHRFTIPRISKILKDLKLEFIGFDISKPLSKTEYAKLFPIDKTNISLDNWHQFEKNNPNTFSGMYQFWVRKI